MTQTQSSTEKVLTALEGRSCDYCEEGMLERSIYKGNKAIVCTSCGAPGVQFW